MIIRTGRDGFQHPASSEITPQLAYRNRRQWLLAAMAVSGAGAWTGRQAWAQGIERPGRLDPIPSVPSSVPGSRTVEKSTSYRDATTYNNYYEFGTDKSDPARLAGKLKTRPWTVAVEGLVNKPGTYDMERLMRLAPMEDRVYRLRCVEGWSMVIPWLGFPLHKLLAQAEPSSDAKYVRFETLLDPDQMPGQRSPWLEWPYAEGLRLDEAMHDLTLLSTGLYGQSLLPQSGAPLRLVVPWKYGFKSIKSIVRIDLVADQPSSLWMIAAPKEYGFYANVNPEVAHPRWSQRSERRIGESGRRETLMFNGYAEEVAGLYAGMDLRKSF